MKDFLIVHLNLKMKFTVGTKEREGDLIEVKQKVAFLKTPTNTIGVRIAAIDIAEQA